MIEPTDNALSRPHAANRFPPPMTARSVWSRRACRLAIAVAPLFAASTASAIEASPVKQVWAAPDSDSQGFEQVKAIATALSKGSVVRVRLEASQSHLARARMLRDGRAQFAATSVAGSVFAQEGLFGFADADWGPQAVRAVLMNPNGQLLGIVAAGDAGIASLVELKGKRLARISEAPEIDLHLRALLAHAGLGWKDVTPVVVDSYGAAIRAVAAGRADAAFAASRTPDLQTLVSSKRGLVWPLVAHADDDAWRRLHDWAPYMVPVDGVSGVGLTEKEPVESVGWPYPVLITLARRSANEVQTLAVEMIARSRDYRDSVPGNAGWEPRRQPLSWAIPWHEGAIRVFRDQGLWRSEHQTHNDRLIARQQVLKQAWEATHRPPASGSDREPADDKRWLKARAEALIRAGFAPMWDGATD